MGRLASFCLSLLLALGLVQGCGPVLTAALPNASSLTPDPLTVSYSGTSTVLTSDYLLLTPTVDGGVAKEFKILSGSLPAGVTLDESSGIISGTTTTATSGTLSVTIRATGTHLQGDVILTLTVTEPLQYTVTYAPSATYKAGQTITLSPTVTLTVGGTHVTATSFTLASGSLPTGLALDATTGVVSGMSTVPVSSVDFTVHARGATGWSFPDATPSTDATVQFIINPGDATHLVFTTNAPASINMLSTFGLVVVAKDAYENTATAYTGTVTMTSANAGSTLVTPYTFTSGVGPTFDNGIHTYSGLKFGTGGTINQTIVLTGSGLSTPTLTTSGVTVNLIKPAGLSYAGAPYTFATGASIGTFTTTNTGGPITGCSSIPALPNNLALSSACVLSGTPTTTSDATYVITATNAAPAGSDATTSVRITVIPPTTIEFTKYDLALVQPLAGDPSTGIGLTTDTLLSQNSSVSFQVLSAYTTANLVTADYSGFPVTPQSIAPSTGSLNYTLLHGSLTSPVFLQVALKGADTSKIGTKSISRTIIQGTNQTKFSKTFQIVSSGLSNHSCGLLDTTNTARCWGSNSAGQLGVAFATIPSTSYSSSPTLGPTGTYSMLALGASHTCGIATTSGTLYCWGDNTAGQLGATESGCTTHFCPTPLSVGSIYIRVAAGATHTCGIVGASTSSTSGTLKCWGQNASGLGNGTTSQATPTTIDGSTAYSEVAVGKNHTCGLTSLGYLKCWGLNSSNQLGDGTTTSNPTPTVVDNSRTYSKIFAGENSMCAIDTTGLLYCWGDNTAGQLGNGSNTNLNIPTQIDSVPYLTVSMGSTSWSHTCGITQAKALKCWGDNSLGLIGDGTTTNRTSPVPVDPTNTYAAVWSGTYYTCALTDSQVLKCWGDRSMGRVGDGAPTVRTTPQTVDTATAYSKVAIGSTGNFACGISQSNGALQCWGENGSNQLGDGTEIQRSAPVFVDIGSVYIQISAGKTHACGITGASMAATSGKLKCWGTNASGLGDGTSNKTTPSEVDVGNAYKQVSVGESHTCALRTDGTLKCWGDNTNGQLGTADSATPATVDLGTAYTSVSAGFAHTCGVTSTNFLKCWGFNSSNQLGDGTATPKTTPTLVDSATPVLYSSVSAGKTHTCGITTGNALKCWGTNANGLGDGSTNHTTPTQIGTNYSSVALGTSHTCATTTANALKCWGYNLSGQLGDATQVSKTTPTSIDSATPVLYNSVAAGASHTCGITTSNALRCWGDDTAGKTGLGTIFNVPVPIW